MPSTNNSEITTPYLRSGYNPSVFHIKTAVLDFDGTISSLRAGWESIMTELMQDILADAPLSSKELNQLISDYIAQSTGIQTIFQMDWLVKQVETLLDTTPLDAWEYKELYNDKLLKMVYSRIQSLEEGRADKKDFLVPGSVEFLDYLSKKGIKIYIASGTDDVDLQKEIKLLGITPYITQAQGAPHQRKDCPKVEVIQGIIKTQGLQGKNLVVIGDGPVEIEIGKEVGALTLGIASDEVKQAGINPEKYHRLKAAGADYIAGDFSDLDAFKTLLKL